MMQKQGLLAMWQAGIQDPHKAKKRKGKASATAARCIAGSWKEKTNFTWLMAVLPVWYGRRTDRRQFETVGVYLLWI